MLFRSGRQPGVGLPIGDVNNQLNANIYMNVFDWFVKRELRVRNYGRYVDDARLLGPDQNLPDWRDACGEFLDRRLRLTLHPTKTTITSAYETNYFLGGAFLPYRRYAQNETVTRFRRYVRDLDALLESGAADLAAELSKMNSRLGYLQHFRARKIITTAIEAAPHVRAAFDFTPHYTKSIIKPTQI